MVCTNIFLISCHIYLSFTRDLRGISSRLFEAALKIREFDRIAISDIDIFNHRGIGFFVPDVFKRTEVCGTGIRALSDLSRPDCKIESLSLSLSLRGPVNETKLFDRP